MKKFFIDMDGVVAVWHSQATMKELTRKGYFETLEPIIWMIRVAFKLYIRNDSEVYILTKYLKKAPAAKEEKDAWLDEFMPFIDTNHRLFVPYDHDKVSCVRTRLGIESLTPDHILLDDYSANLLEWQTAGGTSIKVMNGLNGNHGTFPGDRIREEDTEALSKYF